MVLLLLPANLLPVMEAGFRGETREARLGAAVIALWDDGWPVLAAMFVLFVIVLPFLRAGLLTAVLATIRTRRRPGWLGPAFRYAENLRWWAMPEVMVLAGFVIYMRVSAQLSASIEWGGYCLIAVAVLSITLGRFLDAHDVWASIMPDREDPPDEPSISCDACDLVLPRSAAGQRCPRCRRRLHLRKPAAMLYCGALVLASYILYVPSYYFPMSYSIQPNGVKEHTILSGVRRLLDEGFWYLAVILFFASVMIPLLKLIGLSWLMMRVRQPTPRGLALRTRTYRVVHRIGRWSHTDPFIVALTAPLMSFAGIADVHVGRAALPFALVVTLTMFASRAFDPRLMWDAAEGRP
jgi:paraquat-inducible protein A